MQYWLPDVPTWIWAAAFFIIINAVNLVNVRLYGETEFWFTLIKVLAIIGMIGFGLWLLFSATAASARASTTCGSTAASWRLAGKG
ncbi:hypothetical protein ACNKHO_03165 [Shigella flexneri]